MSGSIERRLPAHMCPSPTNIHNLRCLAGRTSPQWARDIAYHSCSFWVNSMICSLDDPTANDVRVFNTNDGLKGHMENLVSRGISLMASDAIAQCNLRQCNRQELENCNELERLTDEITSLRDEIEQRQTTRNRDIILGVIGAIGWTAVTLAAGQACLGSGLATILTGGLAGFAAAVTCLAAIGSIVGGALVAKWGIEKFQENVAALRAAEARLTRAVAERKALDTGISGNDLNLACQKVRSDCSQ